MVPSSSAQITQLLNEVRNGDRSAESRLIGLVYPELRRMAAGYMRRERHDHTLQSTALVHEVYLRVLGPGEPQWQNRAHFFAVAAQLMRRILVDHARRQSAARRGGGAHRIDLEEPLLVCSEKMEIVLDIDWALGKLEQLDPRQAHVVVFRFFGGLSEEEIASVLGVSARTVKRDWRMARAWLHGILARNPSRTDA